MNKNVYENRKTGKKVVTSEKLDPEHWKKVNEWKTGQMEPDHIRTKNK